MYNAPNDIIQAEQIADAQLKAVVQEGEDWMDSFKVVVESRFSEELNPTVYPQVGFSRRRQPKTGIPECTPGLHSSPRQESLNAHLVCTSEILHTLKANDRKPRNKANIYYSLGTSELGPKKTLKTILNQFL